MTDTTATPPAAPVKPGWQTSEFLLNAACVIGGLIMSSNAIHEGTTAYTVIALLTSTLSAMGYTYSRTVVKSTSMIN